MRPIDADKIGLTDFEIIMCDGNYKKALEMLLQKIENASILKTIPIEWLCKKIKEHTDEEGWQDYLANSFELCIEEWQKE